MTLKSNIFKSYKEYEAWLKTQFRAKIKGFQTDHGGEFTSTIFSDYLKNKGTIRMLTVHDTLQQNGVAECLNRMLLEHAQAMLIATDLSKFLWTEVLKHATWLKN
jgi:transposase InsO family protein